VLVIVGFVVASFGLTAAHRRFPSALPPLLVQWQPVVGPMIAVALAAMIAGALWLPRLERHHGYRFVVPIAVLAWLAATALAVQAGKLQTFRRCCVPASFGTILAFPLARGTDYLASAPLVSRLGVLRFDAAFPRLTRPIDHLLSLRATTHPPGSVLLAWALRALTGNRPWAIAVIATALGIASIFPTYAAAKRLYGDAAAKRASLLLACAPGFLLYSATSFDAIFMFAFMVALAASIWGLESDGMAVVGGAASCIAIFMTWTALALIPIVAGLFVVRLSRQVRAVLLRSLCWVAGLVGAVVLLRLILRVNLIADYRANEYAQRIFVGHERPYWYWAVGNVIAFLITAGVGQSVLYVHRIRDAVATHRPGLEVALAIVLIAASILGLYKGETDHIWILFVPLVAICAAAGESEIGLVLGLGLVQAVATQVLFFTNW
jgi:hypothetical protein